MTDLAFDLGALEASRDLPAEPTGKTEQWRVVDLHANSHNGQLFTESLSADSIAILANDMAANGQLYPVVVLADGVIVDGERRWRAAQQLGWGEITVVVAAPLTDDQVLDRVLAACTSTRQMSVRERVKVYQALAMRLQAKRTGEGMDSPSGESPKSWKDAQEQAALQAGFSSLRTAERAEAVFERGSPDLQDQVLMGKLSVYAACRQLPMRPRASAATSSSEAGATLPEEDTESSGPEQQEDEPEEDTSTPQPERDVHSASFDDAGRAPPVTPALPPTTARGHAVSTSEPQAPAPTPAVKVTAPAPTAELDTEGDPEEGDWTVEDHVTALAEHLKELAERDWDAAMDKTKSWIGAFKEAMGPKPREGESEQDRMFRRLKFVP